MADQGKWFKLHVGWDDDPHLSSLSLEDQARWCKFGTYMKEHGTDGTVALVDPCKTLQHRFEVDTFEQVLESIKKFPHVHVGEKQKHVTNGVTDVIVTFLNWYKYQHDYSRDRMRKMRTNVTAKKRREEKRRDEKRRSVFVKPTILEISDFSKAEGLCLDASSFFNFYESKGWVVGKSPMKDWRAAARGWKTNHSEGKPDVANIH